MPLKDGELESALEQGGSDIDDLTDAELAQLDRGDDFDPAFDANQRQTEDLDGVTGEKPAEEKADDDKDDEESGGDAETEAEADDETEAETVQGVEDEEEEEKPAKKPKGENTAKRQLVPSFRLREVTQKRKAVEAENQTLKQRIAQLEAGGGTGGDPPPDLVAESETALGELRTSGTQLQKELSEAMLDDDTRKVAEIQAKIQKNQEDILDKRMEQMELRNEARMETRLAEREKQTEARVRKAQMDTAIASFEKANPIFDPDNDEFDEDISAAAVEFAEFRLAKGDDITVALEKGAHAAIVEAGLDPKEFLDIKPAKSGKGTQRKQEARKKAAKAASRQPPRLSKRGKTSQDQLAGGLPDITNMSEDEIMALPPAKLALLRGDLNRGS